MPDELLEPTLDEQIESILDEPTETKEEQKPPTETEIPEEKTETETETKEEYPENFLNEDGSVKVEDLFKAYQELKPLEDEKAAWEQEKIELQKQAEFAKQFKAQQDAKAFELGFQSQEEKEFAQTVAKAQSTEFQKFLHLVEDPNRVRGLLAIYEQSPSEKLLEQIEDEFNVDVVKHVSIFTERYKTQLQQYQANQRYEIIKQEAQNFVQQSMKDFPEWFKIPEFTNFFADALRIKGDTFATSDFVKHIENLRQYFRNELLEEQKANKENEQAKNQLTNLSPKTSKTQQIPNKKIEDYTPEELDAAISELV